MAPGNILSERKRNDVERQVAEANVALEAGLADYFLNRLSGAQKMRILPHFRDRVAYIDIETTGLGAEDVITTIALVANGRAHVFVRGANLSDFLAHVARAAVLVTFNGARFDLPRLRREFAIDLGLPHVDLLPALRDLGCRGGQKQCAAQLVAGRQTPGSSLTGADAVELWRKFRETGDDEYLKRLVQYNLEDAVTLELLAVAAYNRVMSGHPLFRPIPRPRLPVAQPSAFPFAR